jgi:transposase InsO family protein
MQVACRFHAVLCELVSGGFGREIIAGQAVGLLQALSVTQAEAVLKAATSTRLETIWRILSRRGFVAPQPHKRPRSSWHRFAADLPNELWQADITHWPLADGSDAEILNIIDDHSRLLAGSTARAVFKAGDIVAGLHLAMGRHGRPERMLTDNGAVFTGLYRGRGWVALEREPAALGIGLSHCRPYHPQTCGKVERFHQTLKKWLARHDLAATIGGLQAQLDQFTAYYNTARPHRAIGRRTPKPPGTPAPGPYRRGRASASASTSASAATASTPTANSPCATTAGSTTSASAAAGPAPKSSSSPAT